ncbi:hypothetical protein [Gorillibacterium sp. CAU 1737]|uniref:hypothetical protein n=1 Tax=Gorillibacterium sp. CAU 1737 TaxID=3140362 RepID=UPI0032610BD0
MRRLGLVVVMIFTLLFVQDRPSQIQVDTRPELNDYTAGFANSTEETYSGMYQDGERFVYLVVGKEPYRTVIAETPGKTSSRMYREVKYSLKKLEQTVEQLKSLRHCPSSRGKSRFVSKGFMGDRCNEQSSCLHR